MEQIDEVTREKLREWQRRRLAVKDQMASQPEKTLELSRVLDQMDDEHALILAGSTLTHAAEPTGQATPLFRAGLVELTRPAATHPFAIELNVTAHSLADLRKLLGMAVYELQQHINEHSTSGSGESNQYPGSMSGTLGGYDFNIGLGSGRGND